jgi:N-acetylglucosaminyl-diphospho-decaprenol L-rhamnosyltransferase
MRRPELSIVICSYKSPELLRLCLESIRRNVKGTEYEAIVCDGETGEDTAMMMREDFPDVRFFPFRDNVGFQGLARRGLAASRAPYLLLLNADILVTPHSIERLLGFLKGRPDVGMVGPQLLNFNETFQDSCFRFYKPVTILYRRTFLKGFGFAKKHLDWFSMRDYDHKDPREVGWLMGSAMLFPRSAFEKVGPMDPRFFMYMEDVDWCRRFWEAGYKVVYYPYARMYHYHGKGSAKGGFLRSLLFNRLTWHHIASAARYFLKYRGKPLPEHL